MPLLKFQPSYIEISLEKKVVLKFVSGRYNPELQLNTTASVNNRMHRIHIRGTKHSCTVNNHSKCRNSFLPVNLLFMYDCINKEVKIAMVKLCRQSFFTRDIYNGWGETFRRTLNLTKMVGTPLWCLQVMGFSSNPETTSQRIPE